MKKPNQAQLWILKLTAFTESKTFYYTDRITCWIWAGPAIFNTYTLGLPVEIVTKITGEFPYALQQCAEWMVSQTIIWILQESTVHLWKKKKYSILLGSDP